MAMAEQGLSTDSSVSIHDLPSADREVEIVEGDHAYLDENTQNDQHTLQGESSEGSVWGAAGGI